MKLPQKPPPWDQVLQDRAGEVVKAFTDPAYEGFARRAEAQYLHWESVRFKAADKKLDPEIAWAMIKIGRGNQKKPLPLQGYESDLTYTIPDSVQRELMLNDQELAGRLGTEIDQPFTSSQRERFIINALREEAIASSMLEGATTTRKHAKDMLRSGRRPKNKSEWMVLNNYRAIMFIREHLEEELSPELLLEIQAILTRNTLDNEDEIGRFRTQSDDIRVVDSRDGTVVHTPPPASELRRRISTLCKFANQNMSAEPFLHPIVKACVLHFQIGFDHPFCDGNGRTARAVFYWSVLRDGYWLFEYLPISRLIYRSPIGYSRAYLYTETDDFDLTYFLIYKLRLVSMARQELREYLSAKQAEFSQARSIFKSDSELNNRQRELVLLFARDPDLVMTIQGHQARANVVYETARMDLLDLVERGYLVQSRVRNQYQFSRGRRIKALPRRKLRKGYRPTISRLE